MLLIFTFSCHTAIINPFYVPESTIHTRYSSEGSELAMSIYPPSVGAGETHTGVIVFIHGGAWSAGGSDIHFYQDWEGFIRRNHLRAFSIEHRTAPAYKGIDPVHDVENALIFIRNHAAEYQIPEQNYFLVGYSSGAHLALTSALRLSASQGKLRHLVGSVVAYFGPTDLTRLYFTSPPDIKQALRNYLPDCKDVDEFIELYGSTVHGGKREDLTSRLMAGEVNGPFFQNMFHKSPSLIPHYEKVAGIIKSWNSLSPIYLLHAGAPPILLLHGKQDEVVPVEQSRELAERSKKYHMQVTFIELPQFRHNFIASRNQRAKIVQREVEEFLSQTESQKPDR